MRNKNGINMYIDYSRSYRKRGRRKGVRNLRILFVLFLAIIVGFSTFLVIKKQIDVENGGNSTLLGQDNGQEQAGVTQPVQNLDQKGTGQETTDETGEHMDTVTDSQAGTDTDPGEEQEKADTRIPVRVRGLYVTSSAAMEMREDLISIADTTEINAMVIDVKDDSGKITYKMDSAMANEIGAVTNTISDIDSLISTLKEKDIYVIARIVAFKDPYLAEQRHELALKNNDGSLYRDNKGECWVNPYKHEVWDYLVEIASGAAATGFDEIQFDYIRFSTGSGMSEINFGQDSKTKTKEDIIIEFTKYVYEKLKPLGVFVSADVYGTIISSSIDAGLVGQNYVEMSRYLDYICPMIYPSHFGKGNYGVEYPDLEPFKIIRKVLTASKTKLEQIPEGEHRAIVRPWLQDFTASWLDHYMEYGGNELREQIGGVYGAGYKEWLLWDAGCTYSVDGLLED